MTAEGAEVDRRGEWFGEGVKAHRRWRWGASRTPDARSPVMAGLVPATHAVPLRTLLPRGRALSVGVVAAARRHDRHEAGHDGGGGGVVGRWGEWWIGEGVEKRRRWRWGASRTPDPRSPVMVGLVPATHAEPSRTPLPRGRALSVGVVAAARRG